MSHLTKEDIANLLEGSLSEFTQEQFETHLYSCDSCLETYMQQVHEKQGVLPILEDPHSFTDQIIAQVPVRSQKKKERHTTVLHYFLAAAATIFLMSSGVFHSIFAYTNQIDSHGAQSSQVTTSIIDKLFFYFDNISLKEER
ncbi:anti-sigma factor [Sutcliffiella halmapala]|uniref:hypothetical protein n=1 Tax=Sutcliffiella halmapala TaxID=79882 RepID=UPI0009955330|nr:hypothetical protein [Sutcliffiella halmapala]